jgi:hypothetical protein
MLIINFAIDIVGRFGCGSSSTRTTVVNGPFTSISAFLHTCEIALVSDATSETPFKPCTRKDIRLLVCTTQSVPAHHRKPVRLTQDAHYLLVRRPVCGLTRYAAVEGCLARLAALQRVVGVRNRRSFRRRALVFVTGCASDREQSPPLRIHAGRSLPSVGDAG